MNFRKDNILQIKKQNILQNNKIVQTINHNYLKIITHLLKNHSFKIKEAENSLRKYCCTSPANHS